MMMKPLLVFLFVGYGLGLGQNAEKAGAPEKFYKLDFVLKDLDGGKVVGTKSYSMEMSTRAPGVIRAGSKIFMKSGALNPYDVGTNVDCSDVQDLRDDISLRLSVSTSSLLQQEGDLYPVVRENKWSSLVIVPLKKSVVVFSSDDATTKRVLQFEITATPR